MPVYTVTAPDGRELEIDGPTAPTEAELDEIFSAAGSSGTVDEAESQRGRMPAGMKPIASHAARVVADLHPHAKVGRAVIDYGKGLAADAASTVYHGGDLIRRGLGMERVIDRPEVQEAMTPPDSTAGRLGLLTGQIGTFAVPLARVSKATAGMRLLPRMAAEAAAGAGVAGIQTGGDPETMTGAAVVGAALPVAGATVRGVRGIVGRAAAGAEDGGVGGAIANVVRSAAPVEPKAMLVQALKPRNTNPRFAESLERALPELKATEAELGKPIAGLDDLTTAAAAAKKRIWAQYEQLAGGQRAIGREIDLSPVADAMASSVPRKVRLEDPRKAAAILETADIYRKPFSLEEAEQLLKETNAELDAFYGKHPFAQRSKLTADPEMAHKVAQANALRQAIYSALDGAGEGAAARELKRRYGALLEIEEEASRRVNVARRQQPESLNEQISAARAAGDYAKGAWRIAHGDITGAADIVGAKAMRSASTYLKEQQTTDALIRRAFEAYRS